MASNDGAGAVPDDSSGAGRCPLWPGQGGGRARGGRPAEQGLGVGPVRRRWPEEARGAGTERGSARPEVL